MLASVYIWLTAVELFFFCVCFFCITFHLCLEDLQERLRCRFWCVFELAAFLKSHNGPEEVRIRPALLGPFAFVITCSLLVLTLEVSILTAYDIRGLDATLCTGLAVLLVMYCAASECRSYFRSLEIFGQQMTNLQLDKTACWCCSVNHKTSSGATVPCDREAARRWI